MYQNFILRLSPLNAFQKLKLFFPVDSRIRMLDRMIMVCAVAGPFATLPQVIIIYTTQAAGISLLSWSLYIVFNIPLVIYGLVHKENIITFHSSLNIFMEIAVVIGAILYG